jgi:hypothetical protein
MEKIITYWGQKAKVTCDENCNKAFGRTQRPTVQLSDDEDDFAYLADNEVPDAPINPGTYEGGDAKPVDKIGIPNKWCVRECERCAISHPGEYNLPLSPENFDKRVYNIPRNQTEQ